MSLPDDPRITTERATPAQPPQLITPFAKTTPPMPLARQPQGVAEYQPSYPEHDNTAPVYTDVPQNFTRSNERNSR